MLTAKQTATKLDRQMWLQTLAAGRPPTIADTVRMRRHLRRITPTARCENAEVQLFHGDQWLPIQLVARLVLMTERRRGDG